MTTLYRAGQPVARLPGLRIPHGIHNRWFNFKLGCVGARVFVEYEGRLVYETIDPRPIQQGYVGLWTENSGICVPRVRIWCQHEFGDIPGAAGG